MNRFIILILLGILPCLATAQQLGTTITLNSKHLGEQREIVVSLPPYYEEEPFYRFPVLYLTDAESQFEHTASMINYYVGAFSPMIVVGINTPNRWQQLNPYNQQQQANPEAEKLRKFITEEVKPYIETHYRTEQFDMLAGHSLGGAFATNAYLKGKDDFDVFLAFSPVFAMGNEVMFELMPHTFKQPSQPKIFFQFEEVSPFPTPKLSFQRMSEMVSKYPHLSSTHKVQLLDGEDHMSTSHMGLITAFKDIYQDWFLYMSKVLDNEAAFERHFETLSKRSGYQVKPTQHYLWELISVLISQKHLMAAQQIADQSLQMYPKSDLSYSLLAHVAQAKGDKKKEVKLLQRAIDLSSKEQPRYARYQERLAVAKEK